MTFKRVALMAPVLLAAITACETGPTDVAEAQVPLAAGDGTRRFVDEDFQDLSDNLILFACDADGNPTDESGGELVRLRGGLYSRFVISFTPAGGIHISYYTMPVELAGTGEASGEDFRVKTSNRGNLNLTANGAVIPFTYTETLVGRETGRSMKLVQKGIYRITGDRVIVDREQQYVDCRI